MRQDRASTPSSYDARAKGLISPVKNQKSCGSCAVFSATSVVETCLYKAGKLNKHVDLSEQWMLDCGKNGKYVALSNTEYMSTFKFSKDNT